MLWQLVYGSGDGFGAVKFPPSDRGIHRILNLIAGRHSVRSCVRDTDGLLDVFKSRTTDEFLVGTGNRLVSRTFILGPQEIFDSGIERAGEGRGIAVRKDET